MAIGDEADEPYYNILTVDGGGIRGIISAACLSNIEAEAYEYAISKEEYKQRGSKSLPKFFHDDKIIHTAYLFDMLAGTSTGSILSAGLVVKDPDNDKKPRYTAHQGMQVFIDGAKFIFTSNGWRWLTHIMLLIAFAVLFGGICYLIGTHKYHNKKKMKMFDEYKCFFDDLNEQILEKETLEEKEEELRINMAVA